VLDKKDELINRINSIGVDAVHFIDIDGEFSAATLQIPVEVHIFLKNSDVEVLEYSGFEKIYGLINWNQSSQDKMVFEKIQSIVNFSTQRAKR